MKPDQIKRFNALKNFFKEDADLKDLMINLAPSDQDLYTEDDRVKYTDNVSKELNAMKSRLKSIFSDLNIPINGILDKFFKNKMTELATTLGKDKGIEDFYKTSITDMRIQFIENIKGEFQGYTLFKGDLGTNIQKAKSVNELLHVFHSYVMNNDYLLRSMPLISEKNENSNVRLYGDETSVAKRIFEEFPDGIESDEVSIIGMDDLTLLMVRDYRTCFNNEC